MTTITSRRALLAGAAAVPLAIAVQVPLGASAADDPTFAAIERHRAAAAAWSAWAKLDVDDDARMNAFSDADNDALAALLRTRPTTMAGLCATLRYLDEYCAPNELGPFADFLNGSAHEIGIAGERLFTSIAETIEALASGRMA